MTNSNYPPGVTDADFDDNGIYCDDCQEELEPDWPASEQHAHYLGRLVYFCEDCEQKRYDDKHE